MSLSLDSRVAGNQDSEAYRERLPREDDESPGRNDSERKVASKVRSPEAVSYTHLTLPTNREV